MVLRTQAFRPSGPEEEKSMPERQAKTSSRPLMAGNMPALKALKRKYSGQQVLQVYQDLDGQRRRRQTLEWVQRGAACPLN